MNNQEILDNAPEAATHIATDSSLWKFKGRWYEYTKMAVGGGVRGFSWLESEPSEVHLSSLADIREIERLKLENKAQQSYIDNALDNSKEPLISRIAELEKECSDLADDLLETENNLVSLQSKFEDIEKELKCENKILRAHLDQYEDLSYELYKTKPSESVSGIALRQLGDLNYWIEIARLNSLDHPDMGANDYYPVGTELRLPPSKGAG